MHQRHGGVFGKRRAHPIRRHAPKRHLQARHSKALDRLRIGVGEGGDVVELYWFGGSVEGGESTRRASGSTRFDTFLNSYLKQQGSRPSQRTTTYGGADARSLNESSQVKCGGLAVGALSRARRVPSAAVVGVADSEYRRENGAKEEGDEENSGGARDLSSDC